MEYLIVATGSNKGQIVHALPDGSAWGSRECLPNFLVVKIDTEKTLEELCERAKIGTEKADEAPLGYKYKFDLNAAFTKEEIADLQKANWSVPMKSADNIKSATLVPVGEIP